MLRCYVFPDEQYRNDAIFAVCFLCLCVHAASLVMPNDAQTMWQLNILHNCGSDIVRNYVYAILRCQCACVGGGGYVRCAHHQTTDNI